MPENKVQSATGTECCGATGNVRTDIVIHKVAWLVWRLPEALFVVGLFWREAGVWLWVPSLTVAGLACIVNAPRCGQRHCFFTGPLYLLGALGSLLNGLRVFFIPLGLDSCRHGAGNCSRLRHGVRSGEILGERLR
jgi:hypothetical protein